jgi:hypothetical protein
MSILRQGRPVEIIYYTPPDTTIIIDASTATSRKNSDGNYYTITFPDDFIGTRGTSDDAFKDVRVGAGPISLPSAGPPYGTKLNVILNIPEGMRIGANTANNILLPRDPSASVRYIRTDPSLYFKFNESDWTQDILTRLNVTVNNHGVLLGAGGSGGWGGVKSDLGKTPKWPGQGGAGSGQGLHSEHGTNSLGDFYDPNDTTLPAGQAGSGYGWWIGSKLAYGANGVHGTTEDGGDGGAFISNSGNSPTDDGGRGHDGGSVIYYTSDVSTSTTGTYINIHNAGWMSAGAGGGSGHRDSTQPGGHGGHWASPHPFNDSIFKGYGFPGKRGALWVLGGNPGSLFAEDDDSPTQSGNFTLSNTIINTSGNTIYGADGTWAP